MNWFKQHADTIAIVTMIVLCFWNLNEKIWVVGEKINTIEKDLTVIKTVLCMKNIMPSELASKRD